MYLAKSSSRAAARAGRHSTSDFDTLRTSSVTFNTGSYIGIDTSGGNLTYSTNLASLPAGLAKVGPNTLTLSGTNAYNGGTMISGGVLEVATLTALPG